MSLTAAAALLPVYDSSFVIRKAKKSRRRRPAHFDDQSEVAILAPSAPSFSGEN
jgi:hypothetical protein